MRSVPADMTRALLGALLFWCSGAAAPRLARYEFSLPQMGTGARIVVFASSEEAARQSASAGFARIEALDAVMSDYREDSEVAALGRRAGTGPVRVSEDLFRVLTASQSVSTGSSGAFDVTVGPITRLWRRARRLGEFPDPARLQTARALTGRDKLILNPRERTVTLREPGMQLDLGGIAKGFAADEVVAVLRRHGITSALVAIGGDIVAMDAPPGLDGWTVAVADLRGDVAPRSILLRDAAVSTSGDSEQWVEIGGVRYSHIIDPRTGAPLTRRSSVTVVAPTGTLSDALATSVSVLGPREGLKLVERTSGAAASITIADPDTVRTETSSDWDKWLCPNRVLPSRVSSFGVLVGGQRPARMASFCAAAQSSTRSRYSFTRSTKSAERSIVSSGSRQTSNSRERFASTS
jgi:FAD:protein FMN transferase